MVGIPEIDAVIKRMLNTSTVQSVTTGSLHERLWLMAVLLEFRVSGMEETSFGKVRACVHSYGDGVSAWLV